MRIVLHHAMCHCMCNDVMHTSQGACMQASKPPLYDFMACQKLHIGMVFLPAKQYLSKLTASHFNTLNMQIASQNVLEKMLIAMQNENEADCNEKFRICGEESVGPLYKW